MSREYKVANTFTCCGKKMVVVEMYGNAICTMTEEEWKRLDRRNNERR